MSYIVGMPIYIFASETHVAISAFTSDPTGGNLPGIYAPWRSVNGGLTLPVDTQANPVVDAIRRDGFFLLSGKRRGTQ
jgi:hypothetical protein